MAAVWVPVPVLGAVTDHVCEALSPSAMEATLADDGLTRHPAGAVRTTLTLLMEPGPISLTVLVRVTAWPVESASGVDGLRVRICCCRLAAVDGCAADLGHQRPVVDRRFRHRDVHSLVGGVVPPTVAAAGGNLG